MEIKQVNEEKFDHGKNVMIKRTEEASQGLTAEQQRFRFLWALMVNGENMVNLHFT